MIETTMFLFCVSTAAMMILVRLVGELFRTYEAKLKAEEYVMHSAAGTRSRLTFYIRRCKELDNAAHHYLMGLDGEGTRSILEARRAVAHVDEAVREIERLVEVRALEQAAVLLTRLNRRPPRARVSTPELYYPWEADLIAALDRLSMQIMLGADRLARAA